MVGLAPPSLLGSGSRHCYGINYTQNPVTGSMSDMAIFRQQSAHPLELRDHRHRGRYAFSAFAQMKALDETAFQRCVAKRWVSVLPAR
jgi:hypothetical protein